MNAAQKRSLAECPQWVREATFDRLVGLKVADRPTD